MLVGLSNCNMFSSIQGKGGALLSYVIQGSQLRTSHNTTIYYNKRKGSHILQRVMCSVMTRVGITSIVSDSQVKTRKLAISVYSRA